MAVPSVSIVFEAGDEVRLTGDFGPFKNWSMGFFREHCGNGMAYIQFKGQPIWCYNLVPITHLEKVKEA